MSIRDKPAGGKVLPGEVSALKKHLEEVLGATGKVACYETGDRSPSKQLKNKLSQALPIEDGILCLILRDREAFEKARRALVERWATTPWPKELSCVALGYPANNGVELGCVVEWKSSPYPELIRNNVSQNVELISAIGSPAERGARLPAEPPEQIWIELFSGEHNHGGAGWEYGRCLWSPFRDKAGADRYAVMREARPGDLVLHSRGGTIDSFSLVDAPVEETGEEPPDAGEWAGRPAYYRVALRDHRPLHSPVSLSAVTERGRREIAQDLETEPKFYPFCWYGEDLRVNQGMYLSACTPRLYSLIRAMTLSTYSIEDALVDVFVDEGEFRRALDQLKRKRNLVLQGAPGVGKTYLSKRLAYALMGAQADEYVQTVQFHQTYAYEDFVQGFRPTEDGFARRDGVFYKFCRTAAEDQGRRYVFIIDEVNRGNVSKIFGELMTLLEPDKRGERFGIQLSYFDPAANEPNFFVPSNVHLVCLMNTADRSLSMVDYALRRRFAFVTLEPGFQHPNFRTHLEDAGVPEEMINRITSGMEELNEAIRADVRHLGPGFEIGHSFFCDPSEDHEAWYQNVIGYEIAPLLHEYWHDDRARAEARIEALQTAT